MKQIDTENVAPVAVEVGLNKVKSIVFVPEFDDNKYTEDPDAKLAVENTLAIT